MADICGDSVLTGQDGSIEFKPPGTSFCLDDFSDFGTDGTTSHITVPCTHDFRVGDIVCFYEGAGASLDSALQASTDPDRVALQVVQDGTILSFGSAVAGSGYGAAEAEDCAVLDDLQSYAVRVRACLERTVQTCASAFVEADDVAYAEVVGAGNCDVAGGAISSEI